MNSIFSPRQLRRVNRNVALKVKNELKTNLMYLVKPRPRWIPKKIWVFLLNLFLNIPKTKL